MIESLFYDVQFVNPPKRLSQNLEFKDGLTAITGPNGKGKTFNIEMVQWLLFGSSALRGKAEDYETLKGTLRFKVKGTSYIISRNKSSATLQEVNEGPGQPPVVASGTKPVNQKILALFGYSYDVFKVANLARQGEIEELGNMPAAKRKALVDETIGLNVLDKLTEFITANLREMNGQLKGMESMLGTEPEPPLVPEGLQPSSTYTETLTTLQQKVRERAVVVAAAHRDIGPQPALPVPPAHLSQEGALKAAAALRDRLMSNYNAVKRQLDALPAKPEKLVTELHTRDAELEAMQGYTARYKELTTQIGMLSNQIAPLTANKPAHTLEELDYFEKLNHLEARVKEKQKLIAKRVPHDCPACKHHWDDEDPRIKTEFADVPDVMEATITLAPAQVMFQRSLHQKLEQAKPLQEQQQVLQAELAELMDYTHIINAIQAQRVEFHKSQAALQVEQQRTDLQEQLTAINTEFAATEDPAEKLAQLVVYYASLSRAEIQLEVWGKQETEKKAALLQLDEFSPTLDIDLATAQGNYARALEYESAARLYVAQKETYDQRVVQVQALSHKVDQWTRARTAIQLLRTKVKAYLLPSLNQVASRLIDQMTGGELSWVNVDEDFEIVVEGQRLETLSGAGKAVANLALRIGLGQVLTNRVFSVLLLDEIDASCDDSRAQYIAQCLRNLTATVGQIIQVSHKQGLEADHYVRM